MSDNRCACFLEFVRTEHEVIIADAEFAQAVRWHSDEELDRPAGIDRYMCNGRRSRQCPLRHGVHR